MQKYGENMGFDTVAVAKSLERRSRKDDTVKKRRYRCVAKIDLDKNPGWALHN